MSWEEAIRDGILDECIVLSGVLRIMTENLMAKLCGVTFFIFISSIFCFVLFLFLLHPQREFAAFTGVRCTPYSKLRNIGYVSW